MGAKVGKIDWMDKFFEKNHNPKLACIGKNNYFCRKNHNKTCR